MVHTGMVGMVVCGGDKERDVQSTAAVLNEIGVGGLSVEVATDNEAALKSLVERGLAASSARGYHWRNITYGSNLVWKQYLRRLTFHAALSFNILTEGQLDAQMLNENDHEWLKLYHYLTTTTELVRCRGYPVTEILAMLTLGIQETVEGGLRRRLRSLSNQMGQFVAERPWIGTWDELGGQVRMNKCPHPD